MIIDTHAHFDPRILAEADIAAKLDRAGVDRVVFIPCMNDPLPATPERLLAVARTLSRSRATRPLVEAIHRNLLTPEGDLRLSGRTITLYARPDNEAVADLCARNPDRFRAWAFLNPRNNPDVLEELEAARSRATTVGIKLHPHWHDWRTEIAFPLLARAEELGLPVLIHLGFGARGDYRAICGRFPKLTVIAAHAGVPFYDELWRHGADHPNLHVDLSSPYIDEGLARAAVRALGPHRCLYGTDAPYGFHEADGSYDWEHVRGWVDRMPITSGDKDAIFHGNALRLLRF